MQSILQDVRYALRQLRKSPGFALTAIVTLALGIGANAVVFSVLNALVLKPVNVPQGQNLYMVQRGKSPSSSYLDYLDLRDRNRSFQSLMMEQVVGAVGIDTGGNPSTAWPELNSGNYFDGLGIHPYLGRFFHSSDEKGFNSTPYVVLSYEYWRSHFESDRGVVGRMVEINKHPFTIIGVAPGSGVARLCDRDRRPGSPPVPPSPRHGPPPRRVRRRWQLCGRQVPRPARYREWPRQRQNHAP